MPAGRELDAVADVDVAVVGELVFVVHVAQHGIGDPGVNALEHVVGIDRGVCAVLAVDGNGHDAYLGRLDLRAIASHLAELPSPRRFWIRARLPCGLEESVRVQPHVELIDLGKGRRDRDRRSVGSVHVPGVRAGHDVRLVLVLLERSVDPVDAVFPRRRVQPGLAIELLVHHARIPVHRPRVVGQRIDARPVDVARRLALLPDGAAIRGSGNRDAPQAVGADGFGGGIQDGLRVEVAGRNLSGRAAGADERREQGQAEPSRHGRLHADADDRHRPLAEATGV